ncbi:MAG: SH3 domain-containing protein [Desulfocapsaceae bacterium]
MFTTTRRSTVLTAVLTVLGIFLFTEAFSANYVSVKGDNVNVRTGAGTNYEVSMELFAGYPLKVMSTQGEWLKIVDFENDSGWIHKSLVNDGNTVIVNGNKSVNMRAEASTNSTIIATVDRGVVLTKLETQGKWLKLKHSTGLIGWIYKPLLWP